MATAKLGFMDTIDWSWYHIIFSFSILSLFVFLRVNRRQVLLHWPVVGMFPGLLANLPRLHEFVTSVLQDSGGTFMFKGPLFMGLNFLVTCDPANAKHMYSTHFWNYWKDDDFPEQMDILGKAIITADGEMWVKQRKMAHAHMSSPEYQSSVMRNCRNKVENAVLPVLERLSDLDQAFDMQEFVKRYTYDLTSTLVLGKDSGGLADDFPSIPFLKAVQEAEEVVLYRHVVPKMWWKRLRWLRVGEEKKMMMAANVINNFIAQCIEEKRKDIKNKSSFQVKEEPKDLLTAYIYHSLDNKEEGNYLGTDTYLRDTLTTFLAAGTDSSTAALSWFIFQVSEHPTVEKKILEELRELRSKLGADDKDKSMAVFGADQVEGLLYLHATLCEALRLFPPIPFNHKMVVKDDVLPIGHKLHGSTMVIFSMYSIARMEKFWGEDCLEFKPERWINPSNGQLKHVPSHEFLAFHTGPRSCLGKNMAITQMKVLAAAMIYNFHVEVVKGSEVKPYIAMIFQMKNGFHVKVSKREAP